MSESLQPLNSMSWDDVVPSVSGISWPQKQAENIPTLDKGLWLARASLLVAVI